MRWKTLLAWYDWAARVHFAGTILSGGLSIVAGLAAYREGWDWLAIVLAILIAFSTVALVYLAFCAYFDRKERKNTTRGKPASLDGDAAASTHLPRRMPILDFVRFAHAHGWRVAGQHDLEIIDLMNGLRQAGSDATIEFWGRLNGRSDRDAILTQILPGHWHDYQFDPLSVLDATENGETCTYNLHSPGTRYEDGYSDIHLEGESASRWLETDALVFRGQQERRGTSRG